MNGSFTPLQALADVEYALNGLVEDGFITIDNDCDGEQDELCGERACEAVGCITRKLKLARAALAKAKGEQ